MKSISNLDNHSEFRLNSKLKYCRFLDHCFDDPAVALKQYSEIEKSAIFKLNKEKKGS